MRRVRSRIHVACITELMYPGNDQISSFGDKFRDCCVLINVTVAKVEANTTEFAGKLFINTLLLTLVGL